MGAKHSITIDDNIFNKMTINAITSVKTECFTTITGNQDISFDDSAPSATWISANGLSYPTTGRSCELCNQIFFQTQNGPDSEAPSLRGSRQYFEARALEQNSNYTPQIESPTIFEVTSGELGPCELVCKNLVAHNIRQEQSFTANTSCTVTNSDTTDIQQNISDQINASLENNKDIFGSLEDSLSNTKDAISTTISNDLTQNITTEFIQKLSVSLGNSQIVKLGGRSSANESIDDSKATTVHSVYIDNILQSYKASQISKLSASNVVTNNLKQSSELALYQHLLDKNNTIGDISKDLLGTISAFSDIIQITVIGIILILVGIGLVFLLLAALGYLWNKRTRNLINKMFSKSYDRVDDAVQGKRPFFKRTPNTSIQKVSSFPPAKNSSVVLNAENI